MATYQSPLSVIIKGAIAGAAGTAVMSAAMERAPQLLEGLGVRIPPAPPPPTAPDSPTEALAERVRWSYGAAWGAYYAVVQSSLKPSPVVHGVLFGSLVGVVTSTVVPRLGLTQPPSRNPGQVNAMHMGLHVVYGVATAIAYAVLNLGRRG